MMHAHQPGSVPLDIPETIPNPAAIPAPRQPAPSNPMPHEPVKTPEKLPADAVGWHIARVAPSKAA